MNEYGIESLAGVAEPVSSWSHLIGALVFAVLSIPMMGRAIRGTSEQTGQVACVCAVGVFCLSVVMLLVTSGLYHFVGFNTPGRRLLLHLDYAAIFVLIAGSYTPACAILLRPLWQAPALLGVWGTAIAGIALKNLYLPQMTAWLGYVIYIVFGSIGIFAALLIWRRFGARLIEPLLLGGAAYLAGSAVQLAYRPELIPGLVGPHEIFHLAILLGIACHWNFVWQFANGSAAWEGRAATLGGATRRRLREGVAADPEQLAQRLFSSEREN